MAALLLMGLTACNGGSNDGAVALYGVPDTGFVDQDQDGFRRNIDCDDTDPTINPDASETVGDGVDSNCDGDDDT